MADQEDGQTEAASEHRLQKAFEDGDIVSSRDLTSWAALTAATLAIGMQGPALGRELVALVQAAADGVDRAGWDGLVAKMWPVATRGCGILGAVALAALVAGLVQTRGHFWPERVAPSFDRLISGGGLKRLFKLDLLIDVGISVVKVLAIGTAIWSAIRADFLTLVRQPGADLTVELYKSWKLLSSMAVRSVLVLALFGGTDFALAYYRHRAKLKMSKYELKREMREEDGDPLLRSRRRRKHRELAKAHASVAVPRADAVIVNPTHVAVAIRYRRGEDRAPRVVAKGKGVLAEHMRELARAHSIPIVEDIPLARLLYRRVKIGGEVPAKTYQAVAAVLAFVYRVTGKRPVAAPRPAAKAVRQGASL